MATAIKELAEKGVRQFEQSSRVASIKPQTTKSNKFPEWVDVLFMRFSTIYGEKWTGHMIGPGFINAAKSEWGNEKYLLAQETETINRAIDICKSIYDWPPSIAKFIDLVRQAKIELENKKKAEEMKNSLPPPLSISDQYFDALERVRQKYHSRYPDLNPRQLADKIGEDGIYKLSVKKLLEMSNQ